MAESSWSTAQIEILGYIQEGMHVLSLSLFGTPWTIAHQAPLSMGFSRQECWLLLLLNRFSHVRCYFLLQGIFPAQGSNPCLLGFLHWQAGSLPLSDPGRHTQEDWAAAKECDKSWCLQGAWVWEVVPSLNSWVAWGELFSLCGPSFSISMVAESSNACKAVCATWGLNTC